MIKRTILFLGLSLLLATATVQAGRSVDESRKVAPDARIDVSNISGSIVVIGWNSAEVRVTGTLGDDVEELEISGDESRLRIRVRLPRGSSHDSSADLEIYVPSSSRLEVSTVSADIEASDLAGPVELQSVSGRIEVGGSFQQAEVETVSGRIRVETDQPLHEGQFKSVSGSIRYSGGFASDGRFDFESVSGSISLRVPSGTGAEFDVSTFSGQIDTDLADIERSGRGQHQPGHDARFAIGGGGADVRVKTFSGSLEIEGM